MSWFRQFPSCCVQRGFRLCKILGARRGFHYVESISRCLEGIFWVRSPFSLFFFTWPSSEEERGGTEEKKKWWETVEDDGRPHWPRSHWPFPLLHHWGRRILRRQQDNKVVHSVSTLKELNQTKCSPPFLPGKKVHGWADELYYGLITENIIFQACMHILPILTDPCCWSVVHINIDGKRRKADELGRSAAALGRGLEFVPSICRGKLGHDSHYTRSYTL